MRILHFVTLGAVLLAMGCAGNKPSAPPFAEVPPSASKFASLPSQKVIVTPESGLAGKVVKVNLEGRFVILNFPIGHLPKLEQRLNVYRLGLKVGEVKVTGPQMDDDIVGDLVNGEARSGDEV